MRSSVASGQQFLDTSHFFLRHTDVLTTPPSKMIHSSLKPWWEAEWKQMRACQSWQEKLISFQCLGGLWWERCDPEGRTWCGCWVVNIRTSVWRGCNIVVGRSIEQPQRNWKSPQNNTKQQRHTKWPQSDAKQPWNDAQPPQRDTKSIQVDGKWPDNSGV